MKWGDLNHPRNYQRGFFHSILFIEQTIEKDIITLKNITIHIFIQRKWVTYDLH